MRLITTIVICTIVCCFAVSGQDTRNLERDKSTAETGKRIALVIGNGAYQKVAPLENPVNDATDVAAVLQTLGFEVIKGTDANLVQMRRLIREFGEKLEALKGIGLFYYAGHGVEVRGKNFLVPVDADISREIETEDYSIDVNSVLRQMDAANNGFNIVILDACRNNPFSRGWNRSGDSGGLAQTNAPTGTYIAFAAAPGSTAADGKGSRNGIFTGALLKNLRRSNLKLEEVFKSTREEVMTLTGNKQVPWDSSSIKGDFYFNFDASAVQPNVVARNDETAAKAAAAESAAWNLVKDSNDPRDHTVFLREFPNGANSRTARSRLDDIAWTAAKGSDDKTKVQEYLDAFPDGVNAAAARILLRQIEARPVGPVVGSIRKNSIGMELVYIPPGEFRMGSDSANVGGENPAHRVTISHGFWMGKYEVTQAQYEQVVGANPSHFKNCPNCPVEKVSWNDAKDFISKLNARNDGFTYSLPTEAEWEYAARAGTTSDFPGAVGDIAWFDKNSGKKTHPVGTKLPNAFGLYDMHGNVGELCEGAYYRYSAAPETDPTGAAKGDRVVRGGSWYYPADTSSGRLRVSAKDRDDIWGFRVLARPR